MNRLVKLTVLAGVAALLGGAANLMAQQDQPAPPPRPSFDPEQMRQMMMDRYKEALEVTSDDEWKVISERIQKVMDARREVGFGGMGRGMFGRGGRGGDNAAQGGGGRRGGFFGQPSAELEALQKAIDAKASADELKAALAKYRAARKQKEANLEKAQEELKQVLNARREAVCVTMGLLN
jgi:predicted S18 family serine protease